MCSSLCAGLVFDDGTGSLQIPSEGREPKYCIKIRHYDIQTYSVIDRLTTGEFNVAPRGALSRISLSKRHDLSQRTSRCISHNHVRKFQI